MLVSHEEMLVAHMFSDKDMFALAFALAGKPQAFAQVALPPGEEARYPDVQV